MGSTVLCCADVFQKTVNPKKKKPTKNNNNNKKKEQSKWNSSISGSAGGTEPPGRGPAGDASSVAEGRVSAELGGSGAGGSPLLGDHSVASQASVSLYPDVKFRIVSLWLCAPGQPAAPARARLLGVEAGARKGEGSSCTEPISTAPVG